MLDDQQVISGLIILLSFFVGYRYGIKTSGRTEEDIKAELRGATMPAERLFRDDGDYKMILVVRNDLKMGKGKIGAQCGHAAVGAFEAAQRKCPQKLRNWQNSGCAKIAVKVESEPEMNAIRRKAQQMNINTCLIRDAGRTQIEPNSKTVLAIGPDLCSTIDQVTGHLKLL